MNRFKIWRNFLVLITLFFHNLKRSISPLLLFQLSSFIKAFDYIVSLICWIDQNIKKLFETKIFYHSKMANLSRILAKMLVLANILSATSLLEDGYILKEDSQAYIKQKQKSMTFTTGIFLIIWNFCWKHSTIRSKVRSKVLNRSEWSFASKLRVQGDRWWSFGRNEGQRRRSFVRPSSFPL